MTERLKFVHESLSGLYTTLELCERYGISRKTGYKWLARHAELGPPGLCDRSHAPHRCPHRISRLVAAAIVSFKGPSHGSC